MVRHRNFQSVIGSLNRGSTPLKAAFNFLRKKIRFNRGSISGSGAMVRHSYFQGVIGPLNMVSIT